MTENVAIPQVHLDMLKEDPDGFSLGFDHKYGEGAASRVLNAEAPSMTEEAQPGYQANSPNRDRTMVGKVWNNTGGAVLHGAQEGFNEMVDTFGDLDDWYAKRTRELGIPAYLEFGYDTEGDRGFVLEFVHRPEQGTMFFGGEGEEDNLELNTFAAPSAMPGQMASGISQFAFGYLSGGRVAKMGGFLGALTKGMIADALFFDPKNPNITAMVSDVAGIEPNAFTELMETDVDDPNWQNRLRNAAEGAVLGAAVDAAFYSARAYKLSRAGRVDEAAEATKAAVRASRKVENAMAREARALAAEVKKDLPPIANDLKRTMDEMAEESKLKGQEPTRGDLPAPVRDPDQPDLPGLSSRDEGAPDLGVRRMTPEEIAKVRARRIELDNADPSVALKDTGITLPGARASWKEWQGYIGAMREVNKDTWANAAGGARTDAEVTAKAALAVKEMAVLTGEDPAALLARYKELPIEHADLPAELVARGDVLRHLSDLNDTLSDAIDDIAERMAKGEEFPTKEWPLYKSVDHMRADLEHKVSLMGELIPNYGATRSTMGRTLRALRLATEDTAKFAEYMANPMNAKRADLAVKAWKMAKNVGDAKLGVANRAASLTSKMLTEINTLRISFLLSGPGTQQVNFISNMVQYFKVPTVQILGAMGAESGTRAAMARHGFATLKGQLYATFDALDAALRVMKKGETELDVLNQTMDTTADMSLNSSAYRATTTLPMRFLMGMDEFFKQSTFRGRIMADADTIANQRGIKGAEKDRFMKGYLADSFDDTGAAKASRSQALEQSRRATYTNELIPGTIPATVQRLAQTNNLARFIVPFVRTPTNIIVDAVAHVPVLNKLSKQYQLDVKKVGGRYVNPQAAAQARGKTILGGLLITGAAMMVSAGHVTGGGPKNPQARALWLKNNRPYSFRIENEDGTITWQSYARLEPMSNLFAITADWYEITSNEYNEYNEGDDLYVFGALLLATAENSVNKTFLQGFNDAMTILSDRQPYAQQRALSNMVASFAPNYMNQTDGDDYYRETRGLLDGFLNRIGVKELDAKRDILGEPIVRALPKYDPIGLVTEDVMTVDPVMAELQELSKMNQSALTQISSTVAAPMQPGGKVDLKDVELKPGQSVFDGLLEHMRTTKIGGKTLREALAAEIKKPSYKKMFIGTAGVGDKGTRIGVIKAILGAYREKAKGTYKPYTDLVIEGKREDRDIKKEWFSGKTTDLENKSRLIDSLPQSTGTLRYKRSDPLF